MFETKLGRFLEVFNYDSVLGEWKLLTAPITAFSISRIVNVL